MDGTGIKSRWRRDFPYPSTPALGPTQPSIQWVTGLSPGVERPRRGADHPPLSCAEVEGRVELYICSPFEPSWPLLGWTLPLLFTFTHFLLLSVVTKYLNFLTSRTDKNCALLGYFSKQRNSHLLRSGIRKSSILQGCLNCLCVLIFFFCV
jgi:hypothetical protein